MIRFLSITICSLFLALSLPTHAAERDAGCEQLLPSMAAVFQAVRQGQSLTPDQQEQWRTWNAYCKAPVWQQRLAALGPPTPPQPRDLPMPEARPAALTWRDYAIAALQGFERGITAPVTVTRCHTYSRRGNVGTYCTSNTY